MTTPETQLASFFARYEPAIARLGKALRAKLRDRLPGLFEVVYLYENQGSLVIAYSPTEKGHEALCSLALYPDAVKLYFARAPLLSKFDPNNLLQGSAKTVRYVVLGSIADFDCPEIEALMVAALKLAKLRPHAGAKGSMIIKAEAQKQRAKAGRARAPRGNSKLTTRVTYPRG